MCGRYHLVLDDKPFAKKIKAKAQRISLSFKEGEIFPGDEVLVFAPKDDGTIDITSKTWGIKDKHLIINTRVENLHAPYWQRMVDHRCAIIADTFYEWKDKIKYAISQDKIFYLAAIYDEDDHLSIITEASYNDLKEVHERTPIILNEGEMLEYLFKGSLRHKMKAMQIKKA